MAGCPSSHQPTIGSGKRRRNLEDLFSGSWISASVPYRRGKSVDNRFVSDLNYLTLFWSYSHKSETILEFQSKFCCFWRLSPQDGTRIVVKHTDYLIYTRMHNLFLIFFLQIGWIIFFSENELLSSTVLKLESNIWVNPWIFEQILAVFAFTISARWRQDNLKTTGLFKHVLYWILDSNYTRIYISWKCCKSRSTSFWAWTVNKKLNRRKTIIGHSCYARVPIKK